jgi:hypothetical protein
MQLRLRSGTQTDLGAAHHLFYYDRWSLFLYVFTRFLERAGALRVKRIVVASAHGTNSRVPRQPRRKYVCSPHQHQHVLDVFVLGK